jgi:2-polyprenyl-3-methyl-5-hydroxy-6-metoxy-1,4-benzoquinol methylase
MGYDVHSVDIDSGNFKARTAFEQLDFNDRTTVDSFCRAHTDEFDLVLGIEVIEHVQNPWEYVANLKSMVRPGGYIILSTPNISSWYSRLSFFLNGRFHQFEDGDRHYGHINPIAEDELRLICERAGLVVEGMRPGGWLPRLWLSWYPTTLLKNLFGFFSSFLMKGSFNGWCLIAIIRKL